MLVPGASPYIIPFFISHAGCPHQCVFCNQHRISGVEQPVTSGQIQSEIDEVLARPRDYKRPVQVAFYGGSFTGLDRDYQRQLLGAVSPFITAGQVEDIRVSTRPDFLDESATDLLVEYGVSLVELGVQSLDAEVLSASGRGHGADEVTAAFAFLRKAGLQVGGQMMVGLSADTPKKSMATCRKLIQLRPDCVRIYPTLVMEDTVLARRHQNGDFIPWSLSKTVVVVAALKERFAENGIPVIRMGLQDGDSLRESLVAGPFHPAFGELVLSRIFFKQIRQAVFAARCELGEVPLKLKIAARDQSLFMGVKKENYRRLQQGGWLEGVELCTSKDQPRFTVFVEG